jgi:intergrase/recombinase
MSRTAKDRFRYAQKFHGYLLRKDFREIRLFSDSKRVHVLKALAAFSKFLGVHDEFTALVRNYGLKWSSGNGDELIISRLTKTVNGDEILIWVRKVKAMVPEYAAFMDFMAATGLRYLEAVDSWNLVVQLAKKGQLGDYYKAENAVLEHFRFKQVFIRKSKKAFISYVPRTLVEEVSESKPLTVDLLVNRIKRRGLKRRFGDIREYNGSVLTEFLREPEIDFLHGRISTSVFMRNYFNPVWITDLKERTLKAVNSILEKVKV